LAISLSYTTPAMTQVNTTTPTQRRATLARKMLAPEAPEAPSPVPMAALLPSKPSPPKNRLGLANLFTRKATK
jgi:hypothetical protein